MFVKRNISLSIFIVVFFLAVAFLTTFRIGIYAFVISYISVIIAKSQNKRIKVPVVDFFVLTFSVGIFFGFLYSYSPKLQYYEFILLHSRWERSEVNKVEIISEEDLLIMSDLKIGSEINTLLFFNNSHGRKELKYCKYVYENNFSSLIDSDDSLIKNSIESINNLISNKDLVVFTKPDKTVFKVFSKNSWIQNSYSASNLLFTSLFLGFFIFCISRIFFNSKRIFSSLINQFPKNEFVISSLILSYIVIYLLVTFLI